MNAIEQLHISDDTDTSSSVTTPQLQHVDSYSSMLSINEDNNNNVENNKNLHVDNIPCMSIYHM